MIQWSELNNAFERRTWNVPITLTAYKYILEIV